MARHPLRRIESRIPIKQESLSGALSRKGGTGQNVHIFIIQHCKILSIPEFIGKNV